MGTLERDIIDKNGMDVRQWVSDRLRWGQLENFINLEIVQKVDKFLKNLIVPIYREGYLLEKR
jgi:hypothetical protein